MNMTPTVTLTACEYLITAATLVYITPIAYEYYKLRQKVDVYPEKLNETIKKIKESIDLSTYEYLTNRSCKERPNNPAIETITGNLTKVVKFIDCSDFVIKTSKVGIGYELFHKLSRTPFETRYLATNGEGCITKDLLCFPKRVSVAKMLRKIIKEHDLDRIQIPKKYLCSFPESHTSKFSKQFYHRHFFILCEKCDVTYIKKNTIKELQKMSENEMTLLANQIHTFFLKSGALDFLTHNYYIKEGKLVIFDTEPMSLSFLSSFCLSPTLKKARINFKNLKKNFKSTPEAKILVEMAAQSIKEIRLVEKKKLHTAVKATSITFIFLSAIAFILMLQAQYNRRDDEHLVRVY